MRKSIGGQFGGYARRVERVTIKTVAVCATVLFLAQFLLLNRDSGGLGGYLNVFGGWVRNVKVGGDVAQQGWRDKDGSSYIVLMLTNKPQSDDVGVFVDGVRVAVFSEPISRVRVRDGQRIEVRVGGGGEKVKVRVIAASPDLIEPRLGLEVSGGKGVLSLGKVKAIEGFSGKEE